MFGKYNLTPCLVNHSMTGLFKFQIRVMEFEIKSSATVPFVPHIFLYFIPNTGTVQYSTVQVATVDRLKKGHISQRAFNEHPTIAMIFQWSLRSPRSPQSFDTPPFPLIYIYPEAQGTRHDPSAISLVLSLISLCRT